MRASALRAFGVEAGKQHPPGGRSALRPAAERHLVRRTERHIYDVSALEIPSIIQRHLLGGMRNGINQILGE